MEMGTDRTYQLPTQSLLQGLAELRDHELLCDVHLVAEEKSFPAHKAVLAATSPYFRAMFTGGFKESNLNSVHLKETCPKGLNCVLDAIYRSEITITENNIENILSVANLLELSDILQACENFLIECITESNCVTFLFICEKFDLQTVIEKTNQFILNNFETITKTGELNRLPDSKMCSIVADDRLRLSNGEIEAFRAMIGWIEYNSQSTDNSQSCDVMPDNVTDLPDTEDADINGDGHPSGRTPTATPSEETEVVTESAADIPDIVEMMKNIRFPLIPQDVLIKEVLPRQMIVENTECFNLVTSALMFHSSTYTQPLQVGQKTGQNTGHQCKPRGEQKLVMIPCGTRDNGYVIQETETRLHVLDIFTDEMFTIQEEVKEFSASLAFRSMSLVTMENYLFLFATDNRSFNSVALRYDITSDKWIDLKPPPLQATIGAAAARSRDRIYLVGGMLVTRQSEGLETIYFTAKTLVYSIGSNTWTDVCDMPQAVTYHAAAGYGDYIYVAGGYVGQRYSETTRKLFAYDILGDVWQCKADMHFSRYQFCLEKVNDKLYACGGRTQNYSTGETSIEEYSILGDHWTVLDHLVLDHCVSASTVVMDEKLYIVGGRKKEPDGKWYDMDTVSCLDVKEQTLNQVSILPFPSARHVCANLKVPRT